MTKLFLGIYLVNHFNTIIMILEMKMLYIVYVDEIIV